MNHSYKVTYHALFVAASLGLLSPFFLAPHTSAHTYTHKHLLDHGELKLQTASHLLLNHTHTQTHNQPTSTHVLLVIIAFISYLCLITRTHIHTHVHTNTHTHVHTHPHTRTHTHSLTHTQALLYDYQFYKQPVPVNIIPVVLSKGRSVMHANLPIRLYLKPTQDLPTIEQVTKSKRIDTGSRNPPHTRQGNGATLVPSAVHVMCLGRWNI
jgi:hypothetical protein